MAEHIKLWNQGSSVTNTQLCGSPVFTCPQSKTIAIEYDKDHYNLCNVIVPTTFYGNEGYDDWIKGVVSAAKVGDYLWLALVPPMHVVNGVYAHNDVNLVEKSSYATMDGITLSLVTGLFTAADVDGNCAMSGEVTHGVLAFTADDRKTLYKPTEIINDHKTWLGVGVKVDALPQGKTLGDIIGKISVGCHARSYETPNFL